MGIKDIKLSSIMSRTVWVTVAVFAVVVGLFFIPEIIKLQSYYSAPTKTTVKKPSLVEKKDLATVITEEKVAASKPPTTTSTTTKTNRFFPDIQQESIFSGLSIKLRDSGGSFNPETVSLMRMDSRDTQSFLKKTRTEVSKFFSPADLKNPSLREAMMDFIAILDHLIGGSISRNLEPEKIRETFVNSYNNLSEKMISARIDRGKILEWRNLPVSKVILREGGASIAVKGYVPFYPRVAIRALDIRQSKGEQGAAANPRMKAELLIKGSDVSEVAVFSQGVRQKEYKLPRPDAEGYRKLKIQGDAVGVWTIVAYDKYGATPFQKSYSFYPRVRNFQLKENGQYFIAFTPGSAENALDRYFTIGYSRVVEHDPDIGVF